MFTDRPPEIKSLISDRRLHSSASSRSIVQGTDSLSESNKAQTIDPLSCAAFSDDPRRPQVHQCLRTFDQKADAVGHPMVPNRVNSNEPQKRPGCSSAVIRDRANNAKHAAGPLVSLYSPIVMRGKWATSVLLFAGRPGNATSALSVPARPSLNHVCDAASRGTRGYR